MPFWLSVSLSVVHVSGFEFVFGDAFVGFWVLVVSVIVGMYVRFWPVSARKTIVYDFEEYGDFLKPKSCSMFFVLIMC